MNKTVLILGASSAIGRLIVEKFLSEGWRVLAYYKNTNIFSSSNFQKKNLEARKLDLADINQIEEHLTKYDFSNVASFINCVGLIIPLAYSNFSYDSVIKSLNVNAISANLFLQKLLPLMKKNQFGRIVHLGSIGVKFGGGLNNYPYSMAKHLLEFFPSEIKKSAKDNILCNTLRVGFVDSGLQNKIPEKDFDERVSLIPMKRAAQAEEIINMVFHLGSSKNTYITCEVIAIAGGE